MLLCAPVLLSIAFRATALTTLVVVASGSLPAVPNEGTSSAAKCELTFEVVYPEDEEKDPYPICFSHCPAKNEVWFDGVAYKHFCDLNRYNMMVEATFSDGELQSCKMVPLLTGEELKTRQAALHETLDACLANKTEESPNSKVSELGPVPDKLNGFTWVGNSFYLVSPMSSSWQDGGEFCEQYGGTLAVIESEEEQSLIQEVLSFDVWIGLSDVTTEGTFANPQLPRADYTNWAGEQPGNGNGKDQDCTMMVEQLDYRWVNASCDLERRALCEWLPGRAPPVQPTPTCPFCPANSCPSCPATTCPSCPATTCPSCPANSHMFQTSVCFHVSGPSVTGDYSQGVNYCTSRGMTLASIHSQDEQTFIERLLTDSVWIGMDDNGRAGDYRWIDGTPRDYDHFGINQPDNPSEHCVEMLKYIGYHWNDLSCNVVRQFLCKSAVSVQ